MKRRAVWIGLVLWLSLLLAGVGLPQTEPGGPPVTVGAASGESLKGSLGLGAALAPEFEGSNKYKIKPAPAFDLRYGRFFLSSAQGLGFKVIAAEQWTVAPFLGYRPGRDEDDSELLRGLGDACGGFTAGGLIIWRPYGPWSFSLQGKQGLGTAKGFTLDLEAAYQERFAEAWSYGLGAGATIADSDYNREYFSISPSKSATSGYRVYQASGGLKHWEVSGALSYDLTEHLSADLRCGYRRLVGSVADSPLVERGSANQFQGAAMLKWNFGR